MRAALQLNPVGMHCAMIVQWGGRLRYTQIMANGGEICSGQLVIRLLWGSGCFRPIKLRVNVNHLWCEI